MLNMLHAPLDSQHGGWGGSHLLEMACRKEKKKEIQGGHTEQGKLSK